MQFLLFSTVAHAVNFRRTLIKMKRTQYKVEALY